MAVGTVQSYERDLAHRRDTSGLASAAVDARVAPPTLLLVDDDAAIRFVYERLLGRTYRVVCAMHGADALAQLAAGLRPDAVLCDVSMPVLDGPAFYHRALELHPALAERFVFMTGGSRDPRIVDFLETTSLIVLRKPAAIEEVLAAMSGLVARLAA